MQQQLEDEMRETKLSISQTEIVLKKHLGQLQNVQTPTNPSTSAHFTTSAPHTAPPQLQKPVSACKIASQTAPSRYWASPASIAQTTLSVQPTV